MRRPIRIRGGAHRFRATARRLVRAGSVALSVALVAGLLLPPALAPGPPAAASTAASDPLITGGRGRPYMSLATPPATAVTAAGYVESEYLLAGVARSYRALGPRTADGRWQVGPGPSAPYRTRLLVERPRDPARFNGTVVVEWLNVTLGAETPTDFGFAHQELLRGGYAWVGVSAQQIGVEGPLGLRAWDRGRYASLRHPGDAYSYDIFTQAGRAARDPGGPLRGLPVATVLADGESQSAGRLVTYLNAVAPQVAPADRYDGFLLHSRGPYGAPIDDGAGSALAALVPVRIRTDLDTPVLVVQAESDVRAGPFTYLAARQADTASLRVWEIAGTAHLDRFVLDVIGPLARRDLGTVPVPSCPRPVNDAPQNLVMNTAVRALAGWARGGLPPAAAPRLATTAGGAISRDGYGNALGGLRVPALDVPTATLSGEGDGLCVLFGSTTPFEAATLGRLYPDRTTWAAQVASAARSGVDRGHLLPEDATTLISAAYATAPWPPAPAAVTDG